MNFKYFDSLRNSEYAKGFFLILSSKAIIVGFTFLSTPIIARLFSPEDYGIYAILNSLVVNLVLITNLTLPSAIIIFKKSKLNISIAGIIGYALYANSFFMILGISLLQSENWRAATYKLIGFNFNWSHIALITGLSITITLTEIFANLNIREKNFKRNVGVNMTDTLSNKISSILIGLLLYNKLGLFFGDMVGKASNILYQLKTINFKASFLRIRRISKINNIKNTISNNYLFPKYNLPTVILNKFSGQLVIWIFAIYFSKEQIGYFTMAISLVGIPLLLLSNALSPLITKKLAEEREHDFKGNTLFKLVLKIALLTTAVYLILYAFSPYFVQYYLGEKWIQSIIYIKILCVPFGLMLISNAISGAFIVYEKQKSNLFFKLVAFFSLCFGIILIVNTTLSFTQLVIVYALVNSAEQLFNTLYILKKAKDV